MKRVNAPTASPFAGPSLRLALLGVVTALLLAVAGNRLDEALKLLAAGALGRDPTSLAEPAAYMAGALLAAFGAIYVGLKFGMPALKGAFMSSVADVRRNREAPAYRALILALSNLPLPKPEDDPAKSEIAFADQALAHALQLKNSQERHQFLEQLCDPKGRWAGWRWQQPLRLLMHNFARVEAMSFVLSPQAAPQYASHFQPLVQALRPGVNFNPAPQTALSEANAVDLTDYNATRAMLTRMSEYTMEQIKCRPVDVCIDITSGTKTYSAAATVMTLNSDAVFSYVETIKAAPGYQVVIYDTFATN
jgi:hypothetical protein